VSRLWTLLAIACFALPLGAPAFAQAAETTDPVVQWNQTLLKIVRTHSARTAIFSRHLSLSGNIYPDAAGMRSLGIFQFFSFKIFRAELSSSSESVGSPFFTARDSIIAPTNPLNKAIACCLASGSSPPICAAIISR